jgi:hypothetical protein
MEVICLLKISEDVQMLLEAVTHLAEGLSLKTFLKFKVEQVPNLLNGHMETNNIRNRTTVNFVL